ncbi:MAG: signal peptidase II [Pseudolabrys sp.]
MSSLRSWLYGPLSWFGLIVAVLSTVVDQASKYWVLEGLDLENRGRRAVTPFMDFVLTWNRGISYGWLQQDTIAGMWLLLAFKIAAVVALWVWLARVDTRWSALGIGLIIGGAVGTAIDRMLHGAVVEFVLLHLDTVNGRFNWYVFNIADVAIVAGVIALLYESLIGQSAVKAP